MARTVPKLFVPLFCFDFFQQDSLSDLRESRRKKSNFFDPICVFWNKQSLFFCLCHIFYLTEDNWQPYIAKYP